MPAITEYRAAEWGGGEALSLDQPFVIRGGCASWPARRITFDYLAGIAGDLEVAVRRARAGAETQMMPLAAFLRYAQSADEADPLYLSEWRYQRSFPEIRAMIDPPSIFESWFDLLPAAGRPHWSWLYVGPKQSGSGLHLDVALSSAWNAVTEGTKRWELFPPEHRFSTALWRHEVVERPDAYDPGECWTTIQEAGDLIFVPGPWAHAAVNLSPCIAFTENFVNASNCATVMRYLKESGDEEMLETIRRLRIVKLFQ